MVESTKQETNQLEILKQFATVNPVTLSSSEQGKVQNFVFGQWKDAKNMINLVDPLNKDEIFLKVSDTQTQEELLKFKEFSKKCTKSGLHNPLKNIDRYLKFGKICQKLTQILHDPEVEKFFAKLIQRVVPKSYPQAYGELLVTRQFIENWCGDNIRFLLKASVVSGDNIGQASTSYRWPYGPVCIICPFNFPLEIAVLQFLSALFCGNQVVLKADSRASIVMEQFLRLFLYCGGDKNDFAFINCDGPVMEKLITMCSFRMLQFTGSSKIANKLAELTKGKIKIEDAGFNWKLLGPDVKDFDFVCYTCDQDAYAFSGQKCSAESILFAHENWIKQNLTENLKKLAERRKLDDLTICPILTWNNQRIQQHIDKVLKIKGSSLLFGGKKLENHKIPEIYGSYQPTAIFVPLEEILKEENFEIVTTELFGPFQIITSYSDCQLDQVFEIFEKMENHLTAAVVSNDPQFLQKVLGNTVNGTTYCGIKARTTGAPQNHYFGPCGDPRGAGIGNPASIINVWTCQREIINDYGPISSDWKLNNTNAS